MGAPLADGGDLDPQEDLTLSEDARRNREQWTRTNAEHSGPGARADWQAAEIAWGVFGVPEAEVGVLGDVAGLDVVELGCGTAYVSAWLARRGARPVGVDVTPAQLETARALQAELGPEFPLVEASAEAVPLPDASFDLAVSEHGASTWCDPDLWIAEAARLLRPGGRLAFLHMTPLTALCFPDTGPLGTELLRPQFGMRRFEWPGEVGVSFQLGHGEWIDVLARHGFAVERLVELQAPADAATHPYYDDVPAEWARRWPAEEIWVAHLEP